MELIDPTGRTGDVWLLELARGVIRRLTFNPTNDVYPVWSPDSSRLIFASDRQGGVDSLYQKMANGAGDDELVHKSLDVGKRPYSWSPDGRHLVYITYSPCVTLGVLPLIGDRQPLKLQPGASEARWVRYHLTADGSHIRRTSLPAWKCMSAASPFRAEGGRYQAMAPARRSGVATAENSFITEREGS